MIEMLLNPKKAARKPFELFFIGLFYGSVSLLIVNYIFHKDVILKDGSGLLLILLTVICCMPFMYYFIKMQEGKDIEISDSGRLIREHTLAVYALMWLFLGLTISYAFWYVVLHESAPKNFNFQIKTYCIINSPDSYERCIEGYGVTKITGNVSATQAILSIFSNNVYVLIFTIVFSLVFGAGAIFIIVWNSSVIAAAMGIFSKGNLYNLPTALLRYMIHGFPEIAAYFIGALAGGIVSVAVIRRDLQGEQKWKIIQDALLLVILAIFVLLVAALMEVYITPIFFDS